MPCRRGFSIEALHLPIALSSVAFFFYRAREDVLKESWKQWRERAYELAVEDCQQWLRTCQHLRGCHLALRSQFEVGLFSSQQILFCYRVACNKAKT